jgi:hypothetical protein
VNSANDTQTHEWVAQKGKIKGIFGQWLSQTADTSIDQWSTILVQLNSTNNIPLRITVLGK